jgi:hypothetical protein
VKVTEKYKATFWGVFCAAVAVWVCAMWFGPLRWVFDSSYALAIIPLAGTLGWLACTVQAGMDSEKE